MSCRATQDGQVMVESSDKTWSTRGGNGKPLQYSCRKKHKNIMKRQEDVTWKDERSRSEGVPCASGEEQRATTNSFRKNEEVGPKWK